MSREHRIHMDNGEDKPVCNVKNWKCICPDWKDVECKYCLRIKRRSKL